MSPLTRARFADRLGDHLIQIMPASRADWAVGMKAEIEAIGDTGSALSFALGCVGVGYATRLRTVSGTLAALRWSLATVIVLFSILVLANAGWMANRDLQVLAQVLGALGTAFMVAGLVLARLGPGVLAGIAAAMLAVSTIGLLGTAPVGLLHLDFYRTLALEGCGLWSALLLAGLVLRHAARSPRLAEMARGHGWDE